ncbi:MAG: cytochrome [Jatrophihabitantaceae bacterium]|nr:cytochrome [Jatrophihabitantaceae bacterium]
MSVTSDSALTVGADFSLTSPDVVAEPYPYFARERARGPVLWHEAMGMWLAFDHVSSSAVLRARTLGRIWTLRWPDEVLPAFTMLHVHSLLENEPPEHTRMRRLVAGAFSRGHVERLRARIEVLTSDLADSVEDAGSDGSPVDLMSLYAEPLPVQVIGELLGVPGADWHLLRPWSNAIVKMYEYGVTPVQRLEAEQASAEFVDYLRSLVVSRRAAPGDDLITSLVQETDSDGARLTEDELITTCTLLLNAGHEATVNTTGNGFYAMLQHPEQHAAITAASEDPAAAAVAIEELIRYDSPLQLFERTAMADTEIGGVTVRAGEKIAALLGAANRDPAVFDAPDAFDLTRSVNPHLGFGAGIHLCVGAPLARVELQSSLRTLVRRFPAMSLAETPIRRPEFVIRGLQELVVTIR